MFGGFLDVANHTRMPGARSHQGRCRHGEMLRTPTFFFSVAKFESLESILLFHDLGVIHLAVAPPGFINDTAILY